MLANRAICAYGLNINWSKIFISWSSWGVAMTLKVDSWNGNLMIDSENRRERDTKVYIYIRIWVFYLHVYKRVFNRV